MKLSDLVPLLGAFAVQAFAAPVLIAPGMKLQEFAKVCDTGPQSQNGDARLSACGSYIVAAVQQIAIARKTPDCWEQSRNSKTSPLTLIEAMIRMAKIDAERPGRTADFALRELVFTAAPACDPT